MSDPDHPTFITADGKILDLSGGQGWEEVAKPLPQLGVLANLNDESLTVLASYGKYRVYNLHENVITEGEHLQHFHIVINGKLEIFTEVGGNHVLLSVAEAGECLGEISLLDPGAATASVRALEEATLWSMDLEDLRRFIKEHIVMGGALLLGMAQCLSHRLRHCDELVVKSMQQPKPFIPERSTPAIHVDNKEIEKSKGLFGSLFSSKTSSVRIKTS